jgi:putative ABC transport system permease protein
MGILGYVAIFAQDLRYALRLFRISTGTVLIAILSLALGIGANTTIFSVVHAVLLAPLSYRDENRLVVLWESNKVKGIARSAVAPATFYHWRSQTHSFEQLELIAPGSPVTVAGGIPERVNIQYATPGLFPLLGITPIIGRSFMESDLKEGAPILVSFGYWRRRFAGASASVGEKIVVNGELRTIAGVLPRDFHLFDEKTDIWLPIKLPDTSSNDYSGRAWTIAVGRLRPKVNIQTAQAEMNVLASRIANKHPDTNTDWGVRVEPIRQAQFAYWKPILTLLFGAVLFVLLICCANVANLLLGRLPIRDREIAVRMSLGASRCRIILQLLHEGVLLGTLSGLLGLVLAVWGLRLFIAFAPPDFPLLRAISISKPILLFCLAMSLASSVIFSIAPAILGSRVDLKRVSASAARSTPERAQRRFSHAFVGAEIAVSMILLSGAGLMLTSMFKLVRIDPGFRSEGVLTMQVFLTGPKYIENGPQGVLIKPAVSAFYRQLLERLGTAPGTSSVGFVSWLPEGGYNTGRRDRHFHMMGEASEYGSEHSALFNIVSDGYFRTLDIPLVSGRYLEPNDNENARWVAVVNSAFVRSFCEGQSPIGKQLITDGGVDERPREIVGVVSDVRQNTLEQESQPEIFSSFLQQPSTSFAHGYQNRVHMNIVMRTFADQESTVAVVRHIAAELDANQPIYSVRTMPEVFSSALAVRVLYTRSFELSAGIALFLSLIGIYGLISQSVTQRTKEVGIRIAVGANAQSILGLFFRQGTVPILWGSLVGLLIAHFSNRLLRSLLFGISSDSALIAASICVPFLIVASTAILIPSVRSTRIDVVDALRHE